MSFLSKLFLSYARLYRTLVERMRGHRFWRYTPQLLLGLIFVTVTAFIFPHSQTLTFSHYKEGDVYIGEEVIAPFTFLINKNLDEYNQDKKVAVEKVPLVFNFVDSIGVNAVADLRELLTGIDAIRASVSPDSIKLRRLADLLNRYAIIIDRENMPLLLGRTAQATSSDQMASARPDANTLDYVQLKQDLLRILVDTYSIGILDLGVGDVPEYAVKISVAKAGQETLEDIAQFYDIDHVENDILEDKLRQLYMGRDDALKIGYSVITSFLQPNLLYDIEETNRRIDDAIARVPLAKGTVLAKERIVDRHERISKEILDKLNSLAQAKAEREIREGGIKVVLPHVGKLLILVLSLSFTGMFLVLSRRAILDDVKQTLMIFLIFMIVMAATFLVNQFGFARYKYLIPISIASMMITIFFDTRLAFVSTVTLSILIAAIRGNDFGIMFVSLFVGTISMFSVREIQARYWIIKGILLITGSYFVAILTIKLFINQDLMVPEELLFALINGVMSPILTYGLMVIFEYFFKMTTDSTLLELSDLNKPLLRQLAIRAPGTYHHSIMVGNLSEAAAEAIGANALLARVGSYYHDIGKMEMPEYFVENQKGGKNPHEKLTPTMSCLILVNHVRRGAEIAEEYHLPDEVCDFIPEHHGTNLIGYFYKKAKENANGAEVNEADFRYPGPKPQTRETGIVMLADAVEAVSRTLKEPTVSRIRSMVDAFIQERLAGAELDECPLTVKDLHQIRESFVNNLTGIFHGRIEYPEDRKKIFKRSL